MFDDLQEVYNHIRANLLRTILTGISVSMGIFLLILLLGAGNGVINAFRHNERSSAMDVIQVYSGRTSKPYDGWQEGRPIEFNTEDNEVLKTDFSKNITEVLPINSETANIKYNGRIRAGSMTGVEPGQQHVDQVALLQGRFINSLDIKLRRKVVVIGRKLATFFFDNVDSAVDKELDIGGIGYKVIGVFDDNNLYEFAKFYVPFTTLNILWNKGTHIDHFNLRTVGTNTEASYDAFKQELNRMFAIRHRYDSTDENATYVSSNFLMAQNSNKSYGYIERGLWIVGLLTLLSGIAGVSNIMLITVRERTHEFGIRKAIGARPWSILRSVLLESLVVTFFFGYFGLVLGVFATEFLEHLVSENSVQMFGSTIYIFLNPGVSLSVALQALCVLVFAGLIAGFLPSYKAVRVKPIEALRSK